MKTSCQKLFLNTSLFLSILCVLCDCLGVYGDILKVKIMYNRRDNALMQFKSYEQALNGNLSISIPSYFVNQILTMRNWFESSCFQDGQGQAIR